MTGTGADPANDTATNIEEAVPHGNAAPPLAFAGQVEDRPYDPSRDRETKRGQIAMRLLSLLIFVSVVPFLLVLFGALCVRTVAEADPKAVCSGFPTADLKELLNAVLTPVVALVGAATGFYFGEKKG